MVRCLFRTVVIGLALVFGAYLLGNRWDGPIEQGARATGAAASAAAGAAAGALAGTVGRERIRETRAEIADTLAGGVSQAETALAETRLTAKIRSKMALDDTLGGSRLDVDTHGTVVTVSGSADTAAQRRRALQLARETAGVTSVIDRIRLSDR